MRVITLVAIAALAITASAHSAEKKPAAPPKVWTQEPDSFMGVSFNKKLEYSLPLCPAGYQSGPMCRDEPFQTYYNIKNGPSIGIGYHLGAMASGNSVDSFYLTASPEEFGQLVDIFVKKYGPPSQRISNIVKTKAGGEFTDEILSWKGKTMSMLIKKYDGDIETSSATIETNASIERSAQKKTQSADGGASKL